MSIGSLSANPTDARLQRLRMIQAHQQARLQEEILETNERIERYTRNQFQLLNSFREKSDQDCALLLRLIRALSEQASELLDRAMPPALDVAANQPQSATARRRNTISSRRELNGGPTTPTTTLNHPPNFLTLQQLQAQPQQQPMQQSVSVARKMSHFDTPPATPEATPMSVGNSPTFRQQSATGGANGPPTQMLATNGGGQSSAADDADDCLFDLEDVDAPAPLPVQSVPVPSYPRSLMYMQEHHDTSFRQMSQQNGLLDDDAADEAEGYYYKILICIAFSNHNFCPTHRCSRPGQLHFDTNARRKRWTPQPGTVDELRQESAHRDSQRHAGRESCCGQQ